MAKAANNVNYNVLMTQIGELTKKAEMVRQKEMASVVANIREQMEKFGLSLKDIQGVSNSVGRPSRTKAANDTLSTNEKVVAKNFENKDNKTINNTTKENSQEMTTMGTVRKNKFSPRRKAEPKYMNPETGQTWSGRGKTPKWLEGRRKSRFVIKQEDAMAA
jgi:DNA-binding protein H-NS